MASIKPHGDGYRVQISVKGQRDSRTFRTKREAQSWASARETEMRERAAASPGNRHTLADALKRYREEVAPSKPGARWEEVRIDKFLRDPALPCRDKIGSITPETIGKWRDEQIKRISPSSVLRELALLSSVFESARREWRWISANPIRDVRKPRQPDHREVLIHWRQIRAMLKEMGYKRGRCATVAQAIAGAFLLALRTGMRAGEICGLTWGDIYPDHCAVTGMAKGGRKTVHAIRDVPLTPKAKRIIETMRGYDPLFVFGITTASLDAMFRKYRKRAGLEGFTFHDTRHTAATMIAPKLHILELCRMFGWGDPKQAMTYYNAKASDIAKRL